MNPQVDDESEQQSGREATTADSACIEWDDDGTCIGYEDDVDDGVVTDDDLETTDPGVEQDQDKGPENSLEYLFPPFGLKITAGDLELRILRDRDFPAYASLLREDIFAPEFAQATFPWAAAEPDDRARAAIQYQWTARATAAPDGWTLPFGVFYRGTLIGSQTLHATQFEITRTLSTGSWLTRSQHGRGLGKLMRQAVLVFAFDYLRAGRAESDAMMINTPSLATSRSIGYEENGIEVKIEGEKACDFQRMTLSPESFIRPVEQVEVEGLTPALLDLLGAG